MAIREEFLPGPGGSDKDPTVDPGDLYPKNEEDHKKLVARCVAMKVEGEDAKSALVPRWERYYKLYRCYMPRDNTWNSKVFVPLIFQVIETITPKVVSQLPKPIVKPVGPEDELGAKKMETLLDWAISESKLYLELVSAYKSALMYGTGILKTYHKIDIRKTRKTVDQMVPLRVPGEPVVDPMTQQVMTDNDGNPITDMVDTGQMVATGKKTTVLKEYEAYNGPAAEAIDIFNFFVSEEAESIEGARWVMHRCWKDWSWVEARVKEGTYRLPEHWDEEQLESFVNEPKQERLASIGMGGGRSGSTRKPVEIWEFWLNDGRNIVVANGSIILRHVENPFDHYEKPFVRIVDYYQPHEFWGVGEIEPLEGIQDTQNGIVNSRMDNLRLILNPMFGVNVHNLEDLRDLKMRPGGLIRLKNDMPIKDVFERVDLGDVTQTAFQESQFLTDMAERTSGVTAYQTGTDSDSMNDTATGVSIIQELGADRFGMKVRIAELTGLGTLMRHFGSMLQQFTTEEKYIRLTGQGGEPYFQEMSPEDVQGAFDYDIEADSTMQTETVRREQAMNLVQVMAQFNPNGMQAALEDLLDSMHVKDKSRYLMGTPPMLPGQMPGVTPGQQGVPGLGAPPGLPPTPGPGAPENYNGPTGGGY